MLGKNALWRRTANQLYWMVTEPRVLGVRLACTWAYLHEKMTPHPHLTEISETDFQTSRRSDRLFIFGSGTSLNAISSEEWVHIADYDTFGFSLFVYQNFVRTDYHLLRELYIGRELEKSFWLPYTEEFVRYLDTNPHFENTILIVQAGWRSLTVNRMIARGMLHKPRRLLRFHTLERSPDAPPSFSLKEGIVHGAGTLIDAINFGVIGGWKDIILTGVDLYDGHYFWEKTHASAEDFGRDPQQIHNTVHNGIIENVGRWRDILAERGIRLWVYNPKSLLTRVLPVYTPDLL